METAGTGQGRSAGAAVAAITQSLERGGGGERGLNGDCCLHAALCFDAHN